MTLISVGIVGAGKAARKYHLPAYKKIKSVRIVGIADENLKAAKQACDLCGIDRNNAFSNHISLIEKKRPDIIDVCVPPWLHGKIALEAMEYNCNVLVEKPMALNSSQADEMVHLSLKKGVKLGVVHNYRFIPSIQKAREYLSSGMLGQVLLIETKASGEVPTNSYIIHPQKSGGIIFESAIHDIDLQYWFMGDVSVVSSYESRITPFFDQPMDVKILLKFKKDGIGFIYISWIAPPHHTLQIIGTGAELFADMGKICILKPDPIKYIVAHFRGIAQPFSFEQTHYLLIREFCNSVINDTKPPVTGEDGRQTIRIAEAIIRSLKEHRPISL
jgi:predicted dehydrogenase